MAAKRSGVRVTLKDVRLCFAQNLVVKSRYTGPGADPNAKEKYQFEGIIERGSENFNKMMAAIEAEAKAEWGAAATETLQALKSLNEIHCMRDGNLKKTDEYPDYKDKLVVSGKNEIRPTILCGGADGRAVVEGSSLPDQMFSGCYVNVILDVKASGVPKKQIYAYLMGVQYSKEGERLSGAKPARADDFEEIPQEKAQAAAAGGGAAALF